MMSKLMYGAQRVDRRVPIQCSHNSPRDMDRRVAYNGEGLIDLNKLDNLDILVDKSPLRCREVLDHLAIDVGEKYLDNIYKEDDIDDEPQSAEQLGRHIAPPSIDGQVRAEKELAWLKVRQLLIEEEEKASPHKIPQTRSLSRSGDCSSIGSNRGDYSCDTVKLLDSMAKCSQSLEPSKHRTPISNMPSDTSRPEVNDPTQSFASLIGNRLAHFFQGDNVSDERNTCLKPSCSQPSLSYNENSPTRWMLLAALEQVTKSCQRMELSDASLSRVSAHLASINQVVREEINSRQSRRPRRPLSMQVSNESTVREMYSVVDTPSECHRDNMVPSVRSSFKAFASAQDLTDTLVSFNNLVADCGLDNVKMQEPWHQYYHLRNAVYSKLGFKQKQLFKLLDVRFSLDVYKRRPVVNKRVCVVGAGPVGLRAAVELALLGGHVSVVEKRAKFSRENRLHLWPWVVQDLASLGAKVLFKNFCTSKTYFHVSTRQLQVILLKVALLVGVRVYPATTFEAIKPPELKEIGGHPFYSVKTEPQIPVMELTAVFGATGVNDRLAKAAGIKHIAFSYKESLGIVCYFPNLETAEETKVKEFAWTTQLKHHMLLKMREVGIDLENIVYFRGEMHYLVMTPKRHNLLDRKVVDTNYTTSKELVEDTNVSQSALHAFVKQIVDFVGIPRKTDFTRVCLLDFGSLMRADKAASILKSRDKKLYVGLIGDSLQEPVWHEGVGTCRGFLSALDGVWMVAQIGKKTDDQLLADRALAYNVMQRVSGQHRSEMQKNVRKYTVDPRSRYKVDYSRIA